MNTNTDNETRSSKIASRIDAVGWALFFVMIGGIGMVPAESIPEATWLIGVGVIMLGNNAARLASGVPTVGFTLFCGALALGTGLCDLFAVQLPVFSILLILVGISVVLGVLRSSTNASSTHSAQGN